MSTVPRLLLLAALAAPALAPGAAAQSAAFRLTRPLVVVDGVRATPRVALEQQPFQFLALTVPGHGRYVVSDRPFAGARRAGEFDGERLDLAAEGHSVRVVGTEPILNARGAVPAYARFEPSAAGHQGGGANGLTLAVVTRPDAGMGRDVTEAPRRRPMRRTAPTGAREATSEEELQVEVRRLRVERDRMQRDRDRLRPEPTDTRRPATGARRPAADAGRPAAGLARAARAEAEAARLRQERDDLLAERDRLISERDRLRQERDELAAALERVDTELAGQSRQGRRDRRGRTFGAGSYPDASDAELRAMAEERDAALLGDADIRRDRDRLTTERAALEQERDALVAERDRLAAEAAELRAERERASALSARASDRATADVEALRAENDRLADEVARLEAERDAMARADEGARTARPVPGDSSYARAAGPRTGRVGRAPDAPAAPQARTDEGRDGPGVSLPGFDFARLQNADEIRRELAEATYPSTARLTRTEGDVLVLFVTDPTGAVTRAEVATPLGNGLDAVAERVVRQMRFIPPQVEGQPAVLRSQLVVRFDR